MTVHGCIDRADLLELREASVHVVGFSSAEGIAVLLLLTRLGFSDLTAHDSRPEDELRRAFRTVHGAWSAREQQALWEELAEVRERGAFGTRYLDGLDTADVVVLGQGWSLDAGNRAAIERRMPAHARVLSMTALYAGLCTDDLVAVTGTNGKSTTVALIDHLLTAGDVPHRTAGNDRGVRQFLPELADPAATPAVALLEVSNRQLEQVVPEAEIAAITSLTPDHLDEHGGWEGYQQVKRRLFAAQRADSWAVVNADDAAALAAAEASTGTLVRCSATGLPSGAACGWRGGDLWIRDIAGHGEQRVAGLDDLQLLGRHNRSNAAVAVATAVLAGLAPADVAAGLAGFAGKAQRLEPLTGARIPVINDVKSTTPQATLAALAAVRDRWGANARVALVAGGDDKGLDYRGLVNQLAADAANGAIDIALVSGTATELLAAGLNAAGVRFRRIDDAREYIDATLADDAAEADVVLVSPGAAGFQSSQLTGSPSLRALVARYTSVQEVGSP